MNILNIRSHYKVNMSNNKTEIYKKIVFLNSKLKKIAGGSCCLARYEIIVGKLHVYKNDNCLSQN